MLQSIFKCQRNLCTKIRKTSLFLQFVSTSCDSNIPTDKSKSTFNLCHRKEHGLSKQTLISEAKVLQYEIDTRYKVSAVIEFFQNHGFSAAQKTLEPKLNFLLSIGFLKIYMGSKVRAMVSYCWKQTVEVLEQIGIPDSQVSEFIFMSPSCLTINPPKMKEVGSETQVNGDMETYRDLGFSNSEILNIFRLQPSCMFYTEENIKAIVTFYINVLHFSLSLFIQRRPIPRCSVVQVLWSRDIVSEVGKLSSTLKVSEKDFLQKYVTKYEEEVPDLQAAYRGKLIFNEYSFHLHEISQISMLNGSSSQTKVD
ncbi:unnamed protein product [Withania somnifera]